MVGLWVWEGVGTGSPPRQHGKREEAGARAPRASRCGGNRTSPLSRGIWPPGATGARGASRGWSPPPLPPGGGRAAQARPSSQRLAPAFLRASPQFLEKGLTLCAQFLPPEGVWQPEGPREVAQLPCPPPLLEPDGRPGLSPGSRGQLAAVGVCSLLGGPRLWPVPSTPRVDLTWSGQGASVAGGGGGGAQRKEGVSHPYSSGLAQRSVLSWRSVALVPFYQSV